MVALISQAGLSWQRIQDTPPRILYALLDYLAQRGPYAPQPKQSVLDQSIPPDQFAALFRHKD